MLVSRIFGDEVQHVTGIYSNVDHFADLAAHPHELSRHLLYLT